MKYFILITFLLSTSFTCKANDIAIDAIKANEKVIQFLSDKPSKNYTISFQKLDLGSNCGFVGCQWRKLVSVIVTSKNSNAPSKTILVLVEGLSSSPDSPPTISFINLQRNPSDNLVFIK